MAEIFISYQHEDQTRANVVVSGLSSCGLRLWWDERIRPGDAYDEVIRRQLEHATVVVVLWSRNSVRSRWVLEEAEFARRKGVLVPALIEECVVPVGFRLIEASDLSAWRGDTNDLTWRKLVTTVQSKLADVGPTAETPFAAKPPDDHDDDRAVGIVNRMLGEIVGPLHALVHRACRARLGAVDGFLVWDYVLFYEVYFLPADAKAASMRTSYGTFLARGEAEAVYRAKARELGPTRLASAAGGEV